jgi:hypothetical protein
VRLDLARRAPTAEEKYMHHYEHLVAADDPTPPPGLASSRFRDPHDVVELAKVDRLLGGSTCPEAWHLDAAA